MITWRLDRLRTPGPMLALATALLPAAMAFVISGQSEVSNVLGGLLVAAALMLLGTIGDSMLVTGLGALMFGAVSVAAEIASIGLLAVAIGLFATLLLHDLATSLRRDPSIHRSIWVITATTFAAVALVAAALFGASYLVATATTWQVLLFPFGIAAIGFAARFAADSHTKAVTKR